MKTIKQKALVAALAAAGVSMFSGVAGAVALSAEGTGETLIYPYYTARGATNTLISVVNTTTQGKVVKVRFREAKDSRDVLDFNLFLSAYDVWTGAVTQNVLGTGARLLTNDTSCTSPAKSAFTNLGNGVYAVDFFNFEYQGADASAIHGTNALAAPQSLDRTLDGYVEIIEQATIPVATTLYKAIEHVNGVPPCTASVIPNSDVGVGALGQIAPTGGLFGAATFVATGSLGMSTSTNAVALNGLSRLGAIFSANNDRPNLRDHGSCTAAVIDNQQVVVATMAGLCIPNTIVPANAVSAVLMSTKLSGEYSYSADLAAATDWVITMPGKSYYTDPTLSGSVVAIAPFTNTWKPKSGLASEAVSLVDTDREEGRGSAVTCSTNPNLPECTFSPRPPDQEVVGAALNWESGTISFGPKTTGPSAVLAANNNAWFAGRQQTIKDGGWLELTFTGANALVGLSGTVVSSLSLTSGAITKAAGSTVTFTGLPVIGFSIAQAKVSAPAPGQPLNNYQSSATLTYTRGIR
jgi:hypothetical protein